MKINIAILFTFVLCVYSSAQTIVRNSDSKEFDSIEILKSNGNKMILNKNQIKSYVYDSNDVVVFQNKKYDFVIENDSLIFFDKETLIDEVEIASNIEKKREKTLKSKNWNATSTLLQGITASYAKLNTSKKTYVKSITFFPSHFKYPSISNRNSNKFSIPNDLKDLKESDFLSGILEVKIVGNKNGIPNDEVLAEMTKDFSKITLREWNKVKKFEVKLDKPVKVPVDGFFIVFEFSSEKKNQIMFNLSKDSPMLMFYPKENTWKEIIHGGYRYNLKILQ